MRHIDDIVETEGALILGAGIAGLFTALKLVPFPALVLAGTRPGVSGSSAWAQGGIAAALGEDDDWQAHAADTIAAGAGLCDPEIVRLVAQEAGPRIEDLVRFGAPFDRDIRGRLALGREAAHSRARIVHVKGDCAGAEISQLLAAAASAQPSVTLLEGFHAVSLAMQDGRASGVFARTRAGATSRLVLFRAPAVIFATGGLGALYAVTTNPPEARGEGLGMAARAGACIADPEFVQFHPTAIAVGRDPAPLATESLRGEGSTLIDESGARFMPAIHEGAELAPRDVVARAIHSYIAAGHCVFLDCREAVGEAFASRFPTVHAACTAAGIDPAYTPIPIAPAAHYHMGGIATDAHGRSSLPGLWAVGECAATGLHGANRLASNSLLEALVLGARAAADVRGSAFAERARGIPPAPPPFAAPAPPHVLRGMMTKLVGLERTAAGLIQALAVIDRLERQAGGEPSLLNMTAAARLVVAGALERKESRGGHARNDFPDLQSPARRSFLTLAEAEKITSAPESPAVAARR